MDLGEGVWKSIATFGQHVSVANQTFQGAEAKIVVDVEHYNLNPFWTAREVNKTSMPIMFSI